MLGTLSKIALYSSMLVGISAAALERRDVCDPSTSADDSICNVVLDPSAGPAKEKCLKPGRVTKGASYEIMRCTATDADDCRDRCLNNPQCKSFSTDSVSLECVHYSRLILKMGWKGVSSSTTTFSGSKCYTFDSGDTCKPCSINNFPGSFPYASNPADNWNQLWNSESRAIAKRNPSIPDPQITPLSDVTTDCKAVEKCTELWEGEASPVVEVARSQTGAYSCNMWTFTGGYIWDDLQIVQSADNAYMYAYHGYKPPQKA